LAIIAIILFFFFGEIFFKNREFVTKYSYKTYFSFWQKIATKKITQPLIYSTHPNVENICVQQAI
jgi:hypothetical protein